MEFHRHAWVEISIGQVIANLEAVRAAVGDTKICAVLKADAYGMGAVKLAEIFGDRVYMYAVAVLDEALALREAQPAKDVLVLGYTPEEYFPVAIENGVTVTMYNPEQLRKLDRAAAALGKNAKVHLKVETGMNRLGFSPDEDGIRQMAEAARLPHLDVNGIFTHFATADEADKTLAHLQASRFLHVLNRLEQEGVRIPLRHIENSPAIVDLPEYRLDMVRAGLILTGFYTSHDLREERVPVKPCVTLRARLANVKTVKKGEGIGYGQTFHTPCDMRIGTVPMGFSDGYSRYFSNRSYVICRGQRCPIVGNICMDQFMIDLSRVPDAAIEDDLILYGDGTDGAPTAEDAADMRGTIVDEVLTNLSRRLPRIYR